MNYIQNNSIVSVVIPVYNVECYIDECLDSVCKQTYSSIEIICIDDGSTDNSLTILKKYAEQDERIRIIEKTNGGLSSARNAGLRYCTGDYVIFIDSDDILVPNGIETMLSYVAKTQSDILVFGAQLFPKEAIINEQIAKLLSPKYGTYTNEEIIEKAIFDIGCCNIFVWNKIYKRTLFSSVVSFDERILLGEDRCFLFDIFPFAKRVTIIEDKLYMYRQKIATSLTGSYRDKQFERTQWKLRIIEHVFNMWYNHIPSITSVAKQRLLRWSTEYIDRSVLGLSLEQTASIKKELASILNDFIN